MASKGRRTIWVDHWTVHQDRAELHDESTNATPAPDMENSLVPRYGGLASSQDDLDITNETAQSLAGVEGSNSVQAGHNHHFGVTSGDNESRGLAYTDTSDNGQYATKAPVARRAVRNQLSESRWANATKVKELAIWRDPPKQFVKANDQSLMGATPSIRSEHFEDNVYVPPHLRQTPAHDQQNAPKPEPQQQLDVAPAMNIQNAPGGKARNESPMRPAPVHVSGPTYREAAETWAFPEFPCIDRAKGRGLCADPDRDPRGVVPAQTWTEQDWNMTRRPKQKKNTFDSESISRDSEVSGATSTRNWAPTSSFDRVDRDMGKKDCATGNLLNPVEYPRTMLSDSTPLSEARIARDRKTREQEENSRIQQERIEKERLAPAQINEETEPAMARPNPFQCKAECHIRPAELGDMMAVAELYKQEVENGWRASDQDAVHPPSWAKILGQCHEHNLPFVVALSGYRDPRMPTREAGHRIIGFSFLDVASRGVVGSINTNAKCSGRLYVMVDPLRRRARIGTALLDAVLRAVSPQYSPKEHSYQWENPREDPTYFECRYNTHSEKRQWCSILIEVYIQNQGTKAKTTKGDEYQAIWNWLEMDFNMNLISHSPMFGRADRLTTSPLLDRLIFEHRCCPAEDLV
ncbi:hypothetical protein PG994_012144 [Apiospora phragmitis]|uniref:N-acetyltransferase domain-containing protein n=1 Tax=Apiospora phragmitis TaxID=2905665 RepID=A0ABR1TUT4_9PEZI